MAQVPTNEDSNNLNANRKDSTISLKDTVAPAESANTPIANQDSSITPLAAKRAYNPRTATILSAILPGLGQGYNRRYWKIPIIYGLGGFLAYMIADNDAYYKAFKKAYADTIEIRNNNQKGVSYYKEFQQQKTLNRPFRDFPTLAYSPEVLQRKRNYFRDNRDLMIILSVGLYLLNVLDAHVDAHLKNFDVNESLTIRIDPTIDYRNSSPGLNIKLTYRILNK